MIVLLPVSAPPCTAANGTPPSRTRRAVAKPGAQTYHYDECARRRPIRSDRRFRARGRRPSKGRACVFNRSPWRWSSSGSEGRQLRRLPPTIWRRCSRSIIAATSCTPRRRRLWRIRRALVRQGSRVSGRPAKDACLRSGYGAGGRTHTDRSRGVSVRCRGSVDHRLQSRRRSGESSRRPLDSRRNKREIHGRVNPDYSPPEIDPSGHSFCEN